MTYPTEAVSRLQAWDTTGFDLLSQTAIIEQFKKTNNLALKLFKGEKFDKAAAEYTKAIALVERALDGVGERTAEAREGGQVRAVH